MGLLSALGFGGGKLDVKLASKHVSAGSDLRGQVIFKGGKRAQDVKAITASVALTTYGNEQGPNGPQRVSRSETIVKGSPVAGGFTVEPGATQAFDFAIPLPRDLYDSEADVEYRLSMSADIDGELDPGDGEVFHVSGGKRFPKPVVPAVAPAPPTGYPPVPAGVPGPAPAMGADVLAQWTDGSWQQARVVGSNGNMIAVDWMDPRFGASTWVQSHQVMAAAPPPPAPSGFPAPFPAQTAVGQPFPGQPVMGQQVPGQPLPGQPLPSQPYAGQPYGAPQPMAPPMMAMPVMPSPLAIGARVLAQWGDGNWYPAAVVQLQGTMVGVDWEDPRLGASAWVQQGQVQQRS